MKLLYDSGVIKRGQGSSNDVAQTKQYEINGQLFRLELVSGERKNYRIYRFSQSGKWEWIEAEGDSFRGQPNIQYITYTRQADDERSPATWGDWWEKLETQARFYADITAPYQEAKA